MRDRKTAVCRVDKSALKKTTGRKVRQEKTYDPGGSVKDTERSTCRKPVPVCDRR